jgi:hypothetical protein
MKRKYLEKKPPKGGSPASENMNTVIARQATGAARVLRPAKSSNRRPIPQYSVMAMNRNAPVFMNPYTIRWANEAPVTAKF